MFQVLEISLADTRRLYQYKQSSPFGIEFGLKGFDNGWLLASHAWKSEEKVLDIGGAYSELPVYIQKTYGCETWVADDFGMDANDPFWMRNKSPQEHIARHPEVKYVLERAGDPKNSSLPQGYFDVVYSISVLEHVPYSLTPQMFRHMSSLVKPGGELLHAIDFPFPSNGGLPKVLKAMCFDAFAGLLPYHFRLSHYLATPQNYTRLALQTLGVKTLPANQTNVLKMVLDPEVVTEPLEYGYNRITKDHMKDFRFQRTGSLLLRLRKG